MCKFSSREDSDNSDNIQRKKLSVQSKFTSGPRGPGAIQETAQEYMVRGLKVVYGLDTQLDK